MIKIELPIRVISTANAREHWAVKAKRNREHRSAAYYATQGALRKEMLAGNVRGTLTRIGKRRLDDDNLAGAFKAIRDGVADGLGLDDGDPRIEWRYAQEIGREYGIRIEISEG
jgi:hypothetical protein